MHIYFSVSHVKSIFADGRAMSFGKTNYRVGGTRGGADRTYRDELCSA
jgi:hypothetical protein